MRFGKFPGCFTSLLFWHILKCVCQFTVNCILQINLTKGRRRRTPIVIIVIWNNRCGMISTFLWPLDSPAQTHYPISVGSDREVTHKQQQHPTLKAEGRLKTRKFLLKMPPSFMACLPRCSPLDSTHKRNKVSQTGKEKEKPNILGLEEKNPSKRKEFSFR